MQTGTTAQSEIRSMTRRPCTLFTLSFFALAPFCCLGQEVVSTASNASVNSQATQPKTELFIAYKCRPSDRPAFRKYMEGPGVEQFEKWRREGVYSDELILFSSIVNEIGWDMLVRLTFDTYADLAKWQVIEKAFPSGLSKQALALAQPVSTYTANLFISGDSPKAKSDRSTAVYLTIEYRYTPYGSKDKYMKYALGYPRKTFNAWLQDGHMSHYGIYLNHDETGIPWGSFVMLEYTDLTGFGSREVAKLKAKAGLSHESSDYSLLNDTSESFRNEGPVMVADVILKKN